MVWVPKKVLFSATVVSHINAFHLPYLKWFRDQGWEVHVAANGSEPVPWADKQFDIPIQRSPYSRDNLKALRELKRIIDSQGYEIIHCHTPMGGVLTRLAARQSRRKGTKVVYTAHGFHFYKGASRINWLIYYPVEKWLSRYTDVLVTMNDEDFERAKRGKFKPGLIHFVHGVGISFERFKPPTAEQKRQLREEYGVGQDRFVLIYAAEMIHRKNQTLLLETIQKLKDAIPNVQLLLAGKGKLEAFYKSLVAEKGLEPYVTFLGHRKDMENIYALADVAVSSSRQEGLPVNIMEAIASGLPVVATRVRGNRDLVGEGVHGFLVELGDADAFADRILQLYHNPLLRQEIAARRDLLTGTYAIENVLEELTSVYKDRM
jgi:glycosyltransferase EpsD